MLFNNTRKKGKGITYLHYGTAKKARQTLRYLKSKTRGEQIRGAQTMYFRAKYHARQTQSMREAMKIYAAFLKKRKQTPGSK
jgi:hypothetical protein